MRLLLSIALAVCVPVALLAIDQSWKAQVSEKDRARVNPYAGQADAIEAGSRLFADHCSRCHGDDAMGEGKHPSLRTPDVQDASDGEIFWILKNGYLRRGMPSWSALPEPSRWQLVAHVKSLGVSAGEAPSRIEAKSHD